MDEEITQEMEVQPVPRSFVVDRKTWRRGERDDNVLLDAEGRMCCLGFVCVQLGVPREELLAKPTPDDLPNHFDVLKDVGLVEDRSNMIGCVNTEAVIQAIRANDKTLKDDTWRECKLREIFETIGLTITFEG